MCNVCMSFSQFILKRINLLLVKQTTSMFLFWDYTSLISVLTQEKNFTNLFLRSFSEIMVRFPSSVQETKTSKFSSRIVVVRLLRTVKLHNQTISFYNCPSRTLKVFLHLHATRSLFQESKRIISSSLRRH